MKNSFKKPIYIISILFIIAGVAFGAYSFFGGKKPAYDFIIAKKSDLAQEVNVTGIVKPAENVNLAFEKSGKVAKVFFDIGDRIIAGDLLVELSNADIIADLNKSKAAEQRQEAALSQYQAILEKEQVKLDELRQGTRPEEIKIAETKVSNAKEAFQDAKTNLESVKNKAEADLKEDYDGALSALQKSANVGKTALVTLSDIQYAHFTGNDADSNNIADAKESAVYAFLGSSGAGRWSSEIVSKLEGGAFGKVQEVVLNPLYENIDEALTVTIDALQKVKTALNTVPISVDLTSTEKTNLDTEKTNVNSEISTLSSKEQAILVQKAANASNISSYESKVNDARNALALVEDELSLKKSGSTDEQIKAQEAQVKQAESNVVSQQSQIKEAQANTENVRAQLAKTVIRSPIGGVIAKQDAKVGEIISANKTIVSVISKAKFEIEANIPEVDIAKIKTGNIAKTTLDAYGSDVIFEVIIVSIEPAETIVEGVATYKTTFQFIEEDERVMSGMTANIDILTAKIENAISVPQRAVITKNGNKSVQVLTGEGKIENVSVETGLRGSDGNIEITRGIKEGDKVIVFLQE